MATPKSKVKSFFSLNLEVLEDGVVKTVLKEFEYNPNGLGKSHRLVVYIPVGREQYKQVTGKDLNSLKINVVKWYEKRLKEKLKTELKEENKELESAIRDWLKTRKIKSTSLDAMEDVFEKHVFPVIGKMCVGEVKPADIRKIIDKMEKDKLSYSYIKKPYIHLNTYFKVKIKEEALTYNPCIAVELPKEDEIEKLRSDAKISSRNKYFTKEQIKSLQDVIYNGYHPVGRSRSGNEYQMPLAHVYQAEAFDFLLQTGLRASELCGLKYSDWDIKTHFITISENLVPINERDGSGSKTGHKTIKSQTPKTKKSKSKLHLSEKANSILILMKSKEPYDYDGYVVHTEEGKPITRDVLRGRYHRLLRAAGIETKDKEEYGLHCTRHSYANFLYQKTKDMQLVSTKLRHTDAAFTAAVYVDLLPENIEQIDEEFEV